MLAGVWGTQVQLQATSDLLGVPVYVAHLNTKGICAAIWLSPRPARLILKTQSIDSLA